MADTNQEMDWTVNKSPPFSQQNLDRDYMFFMTPILPKTKTVAFQIPVASSHWAINGKTPFSKLVDWSSPVFGSEETPMDTESYRMPCPGDSGSGSFISTVVQGNYQSIELSVRKVLVAVFRQGHGGDFADDNGQLHLTPCGSFVRRGYLNDLNEDTRDNGVSTGILWPPIPQWINARIT